MHGRPVADHGIIKPPFRWARPLSDPVGGTDKNNGRHPAAMLQPGATQAGARPATQALEGISRPGGRHSQEAV